MVKSAQEKGPSLGLSMANIKDCNWKIGEKVELSSGGECSNAAEREKSGTEGQGSRPLPAYQEPVPVPVATPIMTTYDEGGENHNVNIEVFNAKDDVILHGEKTSLQKGETKRLGLMTSNTRSSTRLVRKPTKASAGILASSSSSSSSRAAIRSPPCLAESPLIIPLPPLVLPLSNEPEEEACGQQPVQGCKLPEPEACGGGALDASLPLDIPLPGESAQSSVCGPGCASPLAAGAEDSTTFDTVPLERAGQDLPAAHDILAVGVDEVAVTSLQTAVYTVVVGRTSVDIRSPDDSPGGGHVGAAEAGRDEANGHDTVEGSVQKDGPLVTGGGPEPPLDDDHENPRPTCPCPPNTPCPQHTQMASDSPARGLDPAGNDTRLVAHGNVSQEQLDLLAAPTRLQTNTAKEDSDTASITSWPTSR